MKQFRLVDNIVGWLTFLIAAFVYCSTVEPTASFWDCPEFITTGYKLEIGHPPGAPFFMLTANLFSQFTSDPTQVAFMVNTMSALLSAACILFLFWTITHLVRRLLIDRWDELDLNKMIIIEGSGLVGALIYTFSDTFWFSAVEGEVYAYSSFFTAVVFWLILKWEDHADEPHSDRWLVLIMYMTGLSIGVHLLNLLCLPAIVLVYYYKRFPQANLKGSLIALGISFVMLAAILYGVIPGVVTVGGWFELFFVNDLHMPFNTGLIVYLVLLIASVLWAIYETQTADNHTGIKQKNENWNRQNIAFLLGFGLLGVPFIGHGWEAFVIGVVILAVVGWLLFRQVRDKETKGLTPVISARLKNTALLSMLMLMIGYSTYAVIVIRSSANPPMDQNSPEDIFSLGDYMSREQYGYTPLLWGQTYASEIVWGEPDQDGLRKPKKEYKGVEYKRKEKATPDEPDMYEEVAEDKRQKVRYVYHQNMLFPRMHSSDHKAQYESWLEGIEGKEVPSQNGDGTIVIPTFWENLKFFFSYQVNYMYWRYFLWNFAGRQNDIQGHGETIHGNWLSGIPFIDNARLGDQSLLPDELKNNKGHNVYYCLPLLLGLIGLLWQMLGRGQKGVKQFWVVFFLFFMTGLAIVLYLNQTPSQPRERDYAYAGSFYAYAIWCGMAVAAIATLLQTYIKKYQTVLAAVVSAACLLVPIQMASQNWDDHDRSGRYTCRDFGLNYLMSLPEKGKPIIFTNGDNDTFPLWYNQDTEGKRLDVRVCNLSYLQTDWYTDQMLRPAYESPAVPISFSPYQYNNMPNYFVVDPNIGYAINKLYEYYPKRQIDELFGEDPFELKNVVKYWLRDERPETLKEKQRRAIKLILDPMVESRDYPVDLAVFPSEVVYMDIDKEAVKQSGMVIPGAEDLELYPVEERDSVLDTLIPDRIAINVTKRLDGGSSRFLGRSQIMMLDMLANAGWQRPLHVAMTVGYDQYPGLHEYMVQEGLTYRITPFKNMRRLDAETTYERVMQHFKFGGVKTKGIYIDETVMRMCLTHRFLLTDLAQELLRNGSADKALNVMRLIERELPFYNVPCDYDNGNSEYGMPEYGLARQAHVWTRSSALDMAKIYFALRNGNPAHDKEMTDKGLAIIDNVWKQTAAFIQYYMAMGESMFSRNESACVQQFATQLEMVRMLNDAGLKAEFDNRSEAVLKAIIKFRERGGSYVKEHSDKDNLYHYSTYAGLVLDTDRLRWTGSEADGTGYYDDDEIYDEDDEVYDEDLYDEEQEEGV